MINNKSIQKVIIGGVKVTYKEIFNEVVSIMKKDSSTCEDMGTGDYRKYEAMIMNAMIF